MKRTPLLNRHLSALAAELGHLDEIVVADAGLPCPNGVPVIDLSLTPGVPSFFDVLNALKTELVFERAVFAEEASEDLGREITWSPNPPESSAIPVAIEQISHDALKARSASAKAIIRTGECTPYANVILISGVPF